MLAPQKTFRTFKVLGLATWFLVKHMFQTFPDFFQTYILLFLIFLLVLNGEIWEIWLSGLSNSHGFRLWKDLCPDGPVDRPLCRTCLKERSDGIETQLPKGTQSRWWQLKHLLCSPLPGEMIQFDDRIFQMGGEKPATSSYLAKIHTKPRPQWVRMRFGVIL